MAFSNFVALVGIVVFTAIGAVKESAAQSSTLTAFYTAPVVSMAPMWIAKEAGFFKKQGLDVRLVFIASGPLGTTSILSGDVDVGVIGGFAPIRAIAGGAKNLSHDRPNQEPHDRSHRRQEGDRHGPGSQRQASRHRPRRFQPGHVHASGARPLQYGSAQGS